MPWYQNTLFVITADHTSLSQFAEYKTNWGLYSVPILFFKPDNSLHSMEPEILEHIDIMPTVLDYLNYDKDYVAFGRSAFDKTTEPYAFNFKDDTYQLFQGDYLLVFDGEKSVGLYDFKKDRMIEHNLIGEKTEVKEKMEKKIKAIIQQYNNRMIENDLCLMGKSSFTKTSHP
jgi:arylsulfatase A-like enzyme